MSILDPKPPTRAELTATYLPKWKPNTAYAAGAQVVAPTGETVSAKAAFTSGASFSATNWTFPPSGAGSGLTAQNISGVVGLTVTAGFTYELTATANATVTLTGADGAQVALVLTTGGYTVTIQGNTVTNGTYVAVKQTAGWVLYPVGTARTDITPPTAGTLGVSVTDTTAALTVTGAMDDVALHATPYAFSSDGGTTWTAWQASPTYSYTGLAAATSYNFRHQVRDAALNTKAGAVTATTTNATPVWSTVFTDGFTGVADGTALASRTTETGALTYHTSSTASVTGQRVFYNTHGSNKQFALPKAATTSMRFSGAYEVGTVSGSNGSAAFGVTTNATYNNYLIFTLSHSAGTATLSFTDFAAGVWTATIGTATGYPLTGTFEFTYNPSGKSGKLLLNGVQVATFTGDTVVNPTGFFGQLASNFAAIDTLKGEVSSV